MMVRYFYFYNHKKDASWNFAEEDPYYRLTAEEQVTYDIGCTSGGNRIKYHLRDVIP